MWRRARALWRTILRPAAFVPETKRGYELLREMQREKQHMRIVIDEYGAVAGLVTIEDLLEQIVGNIRDEHETDTQIEEPQREPSGSWLVPGSFPADQLGDLLGETVEPGEEYEATTLGGLVSEIAGRIPKAGETVDAGAAGSARGDCGVDGAAHRALAAVSADGAAAVSEGRLKAAGYACWSGRRRFVQADSLRAARLPRMPLVGRDLPNFRRQAAADVVRAPRLR